MTKNRPDAVKGQFAKHPQAENLLVRLFQRVQTLVHRKGGVLVHQQLRDVRAVGGFCFGIFQRGGVLCAAAVVVVGVARHGEQPRPHILPAVIVLKAVQRPEKGLLRQFLGQRFAAGKPLQKQADVPEVEPVDGFNVHRHHSGHSTSSHAAGALPTAYHVPS